MNVTFTSGRELVPWAAPNTRVYADDTTEKIVLNALGGPVPDEVADDPLLCSADPLSSVPHLGTRHLRVPSLPLLDAIINPHHGFKLTRCVYCQVNLRVQRRKFRLWVPCGQSVVELQVCGSHYDMLNDVCTGLVWGCGT